MSKIALDLKKFKHVKSDDDFTTLQHDDGHCLTMAHKSLSPEFQKQLGALAKMSAGGMAPSFDEADKALATKPSTTVTHTKDSSPSKLPDSTPEDTSEDKGYTNYPSHLQKAEGGEVKPKRNPKLPEDVDYSQRADDFKKRQELYLSDPNNIPSDPTKDPIKKAKGGEVSQQGQDVRQHNDVKSGKAKSIYKEPNKEMHYAKEEAKGRAEFERQHVKPKLKGLAGGGPVDPSAASLPCLNPNCKSHGRPHPNCRCYSRMADGGEVSHVCIIKGKHYPDCEYFAEGTPDSPVESPEAAPQDGNFRFFQDSPPEDEDSKNKGIEKEIEDAESFINPKDPKVALPPMADEGIAPQAQAPQEAQTAPADREPQSVQEQPTSKEPAGPNLSQPGVGAENSNPIERFATHKQQIQGDFAKEDSDWAQDLANGHIAPMTYQSMFHDKSTLGKIGTLFGLLIGGAGAGLTHQPNAVLEMMNKTIANDLDAQKNSKADAINYLRLSQQHEMNKANINHMNAETAIASNTLARQKMNRAALQTLVSQVNAMPKGSPQRAVAEQNLAMINQFVQSDNNNLSDRAATAGAYYKMLGIGGDQGNTNEEQFQNKNRALESGMLGQQGQAMGNFDVEHHIPGIPGRSSRPIPEDLRNKIQAMNVLDNKVKDVIDFAQQHKGSLSPNTLRQARQKAEELTSFYNKSVDSLGMTQGRLGWLEEQIKKNPTSLIQQVLGNNATLREIRDSNSTRRNLELKNLGFPVNNQPAQQQNSPMSKSGRPMEQRNGKWYYK